MVYATVALYPLVRFGEIPARAARPPCRTVLAFPGEEHGGKLHFMNQLDGELPCRQAVLALNDAGTMTQQKEKQMTIRDIIKRDIGVKVEGVVKVFDHSTLATEFREYVVTDKIEDELKNICDTFTQVSETLRRGGKPRDVMGIWVSGFFGSGKSHFAKVLGYLLQNDELRDGTGERCIDVF